MAYQLYRSSTVGITLQDTLDELVKNGQMSPFLAGKVLQQYDVSINEAFKENVKTCLTFTGSRLSSYQFCDNVWTLRLKDVEFCSKNHVIAKVDKVKIVACESDGEGGKQKTEGSMKKTNKKKPT
ncbi:transcription initiation factor IIA subunit 2-like [Drosophila pseudoobscura]|uniref:Transcription initiation factor IIA subunit 2 n=1 Tax=Drosophila pseudoobscura pseudoobscura TaxID=46245 RepID=A0A6I8V2J8_DROPS|nr:transcription initiation factor IIA subunit 2 [Drosophila pseudoobscura]